MEDGLEGIRRAAFDHAEKSGTLDDLEKAAAVAKSLADAKKSVSDTNNANRQLRFQLIGSLSSFLVPLVSLLALFATIYVQSQQLSETRQQNSAQLAATRQQSEDTQWRDLLTSLRGSADSFDSDVTVAPRLRSFFHSTRYGDQAKDISVRLMGRLTNAGGFKDLYGVVFVGMTPDVFSQLLNVARSINNTRISIETECFNLSVQYKLSNNFGLCTLNNSVSDLIKTINSAFPERALQLRQATNDIYLELNFVIQNITSYLKMNFPSNGSKNSAIIDLSNLFIASVDWSNINLSNAN